MCAPDHVTHAIDFICGIYVFTIPMYLCQIYVQLEAYLVIVSS